ncbi:MAG: thioredoxin [Lachnospiraceae bacterium]|nr:thioredoxin [Lachnospiraceae bacterium]
MGKAIVVTSENFENEVLKSDKPVLIDFWAAWCGPCQMLAPVIEGLAEEVDHAKICKVNVDEEPELAEKFNVMAIPTLVVIKDGEVVYSDSGIKPKSELLKLLEV